MPVHLIDTGTDFDKKRSENFSLLTSPYYLHTPRIDCPRYREATVIVNTPPPELKPRSYAPSGEMSDDDQYEPESPA